MLKNIPGILNPDLLKVLMEMGHGDELVIADGNFPAASIARQTISGHLIRMDGHGVPPVLEAILRLFPLDIYVPKPVALVQVVPGDKIKTPIWDEYRRILKGSGEKFEDFEFVERFAFYDRTMPGIRGCLYGDVRQFWPISRSMFRDVLNCLKKFERPGTVLNNNRC